MGGLQQLQMSWQPSLLSQKRKNGPPLGLKNLGNSCYINSVLQCLTYTPPLANFCLRSLHSSFCDSIANGERKRECPFCILEKRIARSLRLEVTLDAPASIQSCLRIFSEHFRTGRQEDAHEFLRYVIDACHNTCLRLKKLRRKGCGGDSAANAGYTVVKDIFGGALQSQVKCLSCSFESNKVDEIMDLSLDVLHSTSVKDAMQKFFQPETLDGSNKYRCENCKKLVAARKQMSILQAPNILVIQLKRFEGIFGGKIDKAIAFEEVLVLSSFMCKASQDLHPEYNLFGTIVHSGYSQESGHYYAYIKDAFGRWYCCNDAFVKLSTIQDVLSEKVYILFFSRTNQRPVSSTTSFTSNGAMPCDSSYSEESKNSKVTISPKAMGTKSVCEPSLQKDVSPTSKSVKLPSSACGKFSISGHFGSKRVPRSSDENANKCQSMDRNGDMKDSVCIQKLDKDEPSLRNKNGLTKSIGDVSQDAVGSENMNQNDVTNSLKSRSENNDEVSRSTTEIGPGLSGSKRKLEDACILFAKGFHSQAKVRRLKEELKQEASLVLRSCGWSEKVYSFMRSGKRICARMGNLPSGDDLKKKLVTDAKSTFLSQIPETLKEDLVKRLRALSRERE